jgi:DNA-binding LytR/AlgR family response regulator
LRQVAMDKAQHMLTREYKKRFLVKSGIHVRSIPVEQILYFYSLEKATFAAVDSGRTILLDYSLEQLETLLDPALFFRVNRKYFISLEAITDMITLSNYRLRLVLKNSNDSDIHVSRERLQEFRNWLDQ